MILSVFDNAFLLHPGEFLGHVRPFQVQVIRQLLAVKGNIEFRGLLLQGDGIQVGQQPAPAAFRRGLKTPAGQDQVFPGGDHQQVFQDFLLPGRGRQIPEKVPDPEEQDPAVFVRPHIHQQDFLRQQGVGFCKELPCFHMTQDGAVPPGVVAFDGDAAGQNHSHAVGFIAGVKNDTAFSERLLAGVQRPETFLSLLIGQAPEKGTVFQYRFVHFFHFLFKMWFKPHTLAPDYTILDSSKQGGNPNDS